MMIDSHLFTEKGGRELNEDSVGERRFEGGMLFVVADGLGGHEDGGTASECVKEHMLTAEFIDEEHPAEWLERELAAANEKLLSLQAERHSNMKSTAAVLLIANGKAYCAHVGDSRVYYFHDGRICGITADHSVAYKKYRARELTFEQIGSDEDQSSLLRTMGSTERCIPEVGSYEEPLSAGDGFLLCSDGLWAYLRGEEPLIDMLKAENAREWSELILLRYMERAEPTSDNLSLITVMIG